MFTWKFLVGAVIVLLCWAGLIAGVVALFYFSKMRMYRRDRDTILGAMKTCGPIPSLETVAREIMVDPEDIESRISDMRDNGIDISVVDGIIVLQS